MDLSQAQKAHVMVLEHIEFKKPIAGKLLSVQTVNVKGAANEKSCKLRLTMPIMGARMVTSKSFHPRQRPYHLMLYPPISYHPG